LELVTWEVPLGQQDGAFSSGGLAKLHYKPALKVATQLEDSKRPDATNLVF
jgi:hypothetical protein